MKNKLNKKGFTLVELLAVIVVLAIIMVIATTQITGVIKKNTVNSFSSSLDVVAKAAKMAYTQELENLEQSDIEAGVDYDTSQYTISYSKNSDNVCIISAAGGKFDNMDENYMPKKKDNEGNDVLADGWTITGNQTTACKKFK